MQQITLKTNKNNLLDGVALIKPEIFSDKRGFFYESWNSVNFNEKIDSIFLLFHTYQVLISFV